MLVLSFLVYLPFCFSAVIPHDASELENFLVQQQFTCEPAPANGAVLFSFQSFTRYGFATALHHVSLALAYAAETGRMLIVQEADDWIYAKGGAGRGCDDPDSETCCRGGFTCFFLPVTTCSIGQVAPSMGRGRPPVLSPTSVDSPVVRYTSAAPCYTETMDKTKAYANLWYRAHLMQFLLVPHEHLLRRFAEAQAEWGWGPDDRVLGIHVRQGDKGVEVGRLKTWAQYQQRIGADIDPAQVDLVFVTSDSPDVIQQAKEALPGLGFPKVVAFEERRTNGAVHKLLTDGKEDGLEQGTIALSNIWLLSQCDRLVGTFSSSFFKLAYELRFARLGGEGRHAEGKDGSVISLDLPRWRP